MAAYLLVRAFFVVFSLLPPSWAAALGRRLGGLWGRLDKRHIAIALTNLEIAFPGLPLARRRRIALDSYRNIGECYGLMTQFHKFKRMGKDRLARWVRYEGYESFRKIKGEGSPVLVLTGHLGLWEFMAFAHARLNQPLSFLVRPVKNRRIDRFLNGLRMLSGNTAIPKRNAMNTVFETLKSGGEVGVLVDQDANAREGVFVDLFGKKACMIKGPAVMAMRAEARVLPVFLVRDEERKARYCIQIMPEVPMRNSSDLDADVQENSQRLSRALEEAIARWPDRWLWFHRRWKTRPPGDTEDVYAARKP